MSGRSKSRERYRSDYTMDNGKGSSRNTVKIAYNIACEAVDDYNYRHPGTNIALDTLNLADSDPHDENDVTIPLEFTGCDNFTKMGDELTELARTACHIGYRTRIDGDEVIAKHVLHINPRGLNSTDLSVTDRFRLLLAWTMSTPTTRAISLVLLFYVIYNFVL